MASKVQCSCCGRTVDMIRASLNCHPGYNGWVCSECGARLRKERSEKERQQKEIDNLKKESERQSRLIDKQNRLLEEYDEEDEEDDEEKIARRTARAEAIGNVVSSDGFKKAILWLLLWWILIFFYPIKFIVVGIKEGDKKQLITGIAILSTLITLAIIGSFLPKTSSTSDTLHFEGVEDTITLAYGDDYNFNSGITLNKNKSKVYGTITYSGSVDTYTLGEYEIIYKGVYMNETITKKVKVIVAPFYYDSSKNIEVLKRFKIEKESYNSYIVSGVISNKSNTAYSKMTVNYYCINNSTNYRLNFDEGLPIGDNDFSATFTTNESFLTYQFRIDSIEVSV